MPITRLGNILLCVACSLWTAFFGLVLLLMIVVDSPPSAAPGPSAGEAVASLLCMLFMFGPTAVLLVASARNVIRMSPRNRRMTRLGPRGFAVLPAKSSESETRSRS